MADVSDLPPKYYLQNFLTVLGFVENQSGFLLSEVEKEFISSFRSLPEDCQCLYVRMNNRKGIYFRPSKFQYAELEDIPKKIKHLLKEKWLRPLTLKTIEEAWQVLSVFTKPELVKAAQQHEISKLNSLKKEEVVLTLIEYFTLPELTQLLMETDPVVCLQRVKEAEMLLFLFFGDTYSSMTEFVIRDMGHVKFESYSHDQFVPRFQNRKQVQDVFWINGVYQDFKSSLLLFPLEEVYDWVMGHKNLFAGLDEMAVPRADKLMLRLGKELEKEGLTSQALKAYRLAARPPARERQVRLLQKLNQPEEALALCEQIEKEPTNAEELFFALDFRSKLQKKKFRKAATLFLKEAPTIGLGKEHEHRVEAGVLAAYEARGYEGFFSENYPWRSLFGLLFWEVIYDPKYAAIHQPFQRVPSDLFGADFLKSRLEGLQIQLDLLKKPRFLMKYLEKVYSEKEGIANPFIGWHPDTLYIVGKLIGWLTPDQLRTVLLEMARDLKNNLAGFPDLMVWNEEEYAFLEVKSPNDQLSAQQLYWLRLFQQEGIAANAIKVVWEEPVG